MLKTTFLSVISIENSVYELFTVLHYVSKFMLKA